MPFTPYHGGPGLLLKACLPAGFSFLTFAATQVAIDCETAYHMATAQYPLHRFFHTLVGGTIAGAVVALVVWASARGLLAGRRLAPEAVMRGETSLAGVVAAGVIGGTSHSLLDSIVHADVQPFWPLSSASPLHGVLGWGALEAACVASGVLGAIVLFRIAAGRKRSP